MKPHITEDNWKEWAAHFCTKDFLLSLTDERQELLEVAMNLKDYTRERAYGRVEAIDSIVSKIKSFAEEN